MILQKICFCQSFRSKVLVVCATILILTTTACILPLVPVDVSLPVQPESPLIPGANTTLVENRWRLVEATSQGETVAFDAIAPIYLTFTVDGQLVKRTTDCNGDGHYIIASSPQHYRLVPSAGTARGCGEVGDRQYDQITEAIAATTQYAIQDSQLFLTGDNVRIVLDQESQLLPTANPTLTETQWRLVEVTYHDQRVAVDDLEPVQVDFHLAGVNIIVNQCYLASYRIIDERELHYQLVQEEAAYVTCPVTDTRYSVIVDAVADTTAYELQGNQLFLTGDDVRIVQTRAELR